MRYTAYAHNQNLIDNNVCNGGHSWAGNRQCDFNSDPECMWAKPHELYGDNRRGYEISNGAGCNGY